MRGAVSYDASMSARRFRRLRRDPSGSLRVEHARAELDHYASPEAAKSIREHGFLERYRRPTLIGFSFAPKGETWSKGHRGATTLVRSVFEGNFVDPSRPEDRPIDVFRGTTATPAWNAMVSKISDDVGLDWDAEPDDEWWRKREELATRLRRELLRRKIDAVQAGGEVIVVNPKSLRVLQPRWWGGQRDRRR